jgi:hypothetical protein
LQGLQHLLIATGRAGEVPPLFRSTAAAGLPVSLLPLLDAAAGAGFEELAQAEADRLGQLYLTMSPTGLWLLGSWEAHHGRAAPLQAIVTALHAKRDSSGLRRDSLLAAALDARLLLVKGDTDQAILHLTALRPNASGGELEWQIWESLGLERLALAEVLHARRRFAEAYRVAAQIDSPQPLVYLLFLRRSLAIRARAAEALGEPSRSARDRSRLAQLDRHSSRQPSVHRE